MRRLNIYMQCQRIHVAEPGESTAHRHCSTDAPPQHMMGRDEAEDCSVRSIMGDGRDRGRGRMVAPVRRHVSRMQIATSAGCCFHHMQ